MPICWPSRRPGPTGCWPMPWWSSRSTPRPGKSCRAGCVIWVADPGRPAPGRTGGRAAVDFGAGAERLRHASQPFQPSRLRGGAPVQPSLGHAASRISRTPPVARLQGGHWHAGICRTLWRVDEAAAGRAGRGTLLSGVARHGRRRGRRREPLCDSGVGGESPGGDSCQVQHGRGTAMPNSCGSATHGRGCCRG